jgi:hypothetical protein
MAIETLSGTKHKINVTSHEAFLEAVNTLPIASPYASIDFEAEGVKIPEDDANMADYEAECQREGIIPGVEVIFRPKRARTGFIDEPVVFTPSEINLIRPSKSKSSLIETFAEGGRIYRLSFTFENRIDGLDAFKKDYLDDLLRKGYKISKGDFVLSTYHLTGYNQGDYPDTCLDFNNNEGRGPLGIRLKFGHKLNEEDVDKVAKWFEMLKTKYQR